MTEPFPKKIMDGRWRAQSLQARWLLRRFAGQVASSYRTMDPITAQILGAPGVAPVMTPDGPDAAPQVTVAI